MSYIFPSFGTNQNTVYVVIELNSFFPIIPSKNIKIIGVYNSLIQAENIKNIDPTTRYLYTSTLKNTNSKYISEPFPKIYPIYPDIDTRPGIKTDIILEDNTYPNINKNNNFNFGKKN
jgi:hypothetical protein